MSPNTFGNWLNSTTTSVSTGGSLYDPGTDGQNGVRPVINLDPDKITFTGNGTMQDPYVLS